jgi:hypothetical protein
MKDLANDIAIVPLLAPQDVANTDTASAWLDTQGFQSAVLEAIIGAITTPDSNSYLTPVAQESDTTADADAETVDAADLIGAFTKIDAASEDNVVQKVGYIGNMRYIRIKFDFTDGDGGISAALVAANGILGHAGERPVTTPAAVAAT